MSLSKAVREQIYLDILRHVDLSDLDMSIIAEKYRVSRQTVYRHLRQLESREIVKKDKDNKYVLVKQTDTKTYKNEGLKENEIWKQYAAPFYQHIPQNAFDKAAYIFGEIMNN
ncbi:MAG: helix-turn-helix domain-containing protein, partial [Clostridiales bacterium]|nr:helix-turn-helix domain-containing protein [Clostridiales bacterium]